MFRFYAKLIGKSIRWKWHFENASLISTMTNAENSFKIPCIFKLTHAEHTHTDTLERMKREKWMEEKKKRKRKKILTYRCDISSFQSRSMCLCVAFFFLCFVCSVSNVFYERHWFVSWNSVLFFRFMRFNSRRMDLQIPQRVSETNTSNYVKFYLKIQ